jgi:predicted RNA-binding Zn ribbon-like protein
MGDPAAIAFANTRSAPGRDRIATLGDWRQWARAWPGLSAAARRVDADGLAALRRLRDDIQTVLRAASGGVGDVEAAARVTQIARQQAPEALRWRAGRPVLASSSGGADVAAAIGHHLARMTLDLLLTERALARCQGRDCLKVFVASRAGRRWCDSTVCGNRARVREYGRRRAIARA